MSSKLIAVLVLIVMLWGGTADAMDLVSEDPTQSSAPKLSPISPNQATEDQVSLGKIMEMLENMQTSIQGMNLEIQRLNQRIENIEEATGVYNFDDDIKLVGIIQLKADLEKLKKEGDLDERGRCRHDWRSYQRYDTGGGDTTEEERAALEALAKAREAKEKARKEKEELFFKCKAELEGKVAEYITELVGQLPLSRNFEVSMLGKPVDKKAAIRIFKALEQVGSAILLEKSFVDDMEEKGPESWKKSRYPFQHLKYYWVDKEVLKRYVVIMDGYIDGIYDSSHSCKNKLWRFK